jgi:hypothetical protein
MKNKKIIHIVVRFVAFTAVGLLYTVFIKAEDIGTWRNYLGYACLFLALINLVQFIRYYAGKNRGGT